MIRSFLRYSLLAATAAACAGDSTSTPLAPTSAATAKSSGSGSTMRTITMGPLATDVTPPGDIAPLSDATGGPVVAVVNAKAPFRNLTMTNVSVSLNAATGDVAACRQPGSTRTYSSSFGDNVGTWTGELDIWQGRSAASSNFKFSGSRTVNGIAEIIQFTANDQNAVQTTHADGTTVLRFDDVPMGLGSQSTHYDVVNGLPVLRCLQLTITATP